MTDPQLSRQKLIAYIKSAKIDTTGIDNHNRYMYSLGRNTLADVLIAGIYFGDFDEGEGETGVELNGKDD
jgi:arginine deiminase